MKTIKTLLVGAAALAISATALADEMKLAHFSSTKYHLHNEMFLPLAEKIKEATGGATTIRVYPGGELGKGPVPAGIEVVRVLEADATDVEGRGGHRVPIGRPIAEFQGLQ